MSLNYKNYSGTIEYDERDHILHGRILGIRDTILYEGSSLQAIEKAFREAVDDYLEWCAEEGREPQKPYAGKIMLRVDPEQHRDIAIAAEHAGRSVNAWIKDIVAREAARVRE